MIKGQQVNQRFFQMKDFMKQKLWLAPWHFLISVLNTIISSSLPSPLRCHHLAHSLSLSRIERHSSTQFHKGRVHRLHFIHISYLIIDLDIQILLNTQFKEKLPNWDTFETNLRQLRGNLNILPGLSFETTLKQI